MLGSSKRKQEAFFEPEECFSPFKFTQSFTSGAKTFFNGIVKASLKKKEKKFFVCPSPVLSLASLK